MNISKLDSSLVYNLDSKLDLKIYYILVLITFIFFLFVLIYPYQNIYTYKLYIDDSYRLVVDDSFFPINNNYLYINNKKYTYNVLDISNPNVINNKLYYEVKIDINLKKDKNVIPIFIKKGKTTLFNKFINNMKGW